MLKEMDLSQYPIVDQLKPADAAVICPYLNECEYSEGTVILKQGTTSEVFHIVLSGELEVILENEVEVQIARLTRGQIVGEMSCLTGERVSATVKARKSAQTLTLPREGLLLLMDRSAAFRNQMIEAMIRRIGSSNERVMDEYTKSAVAMRQLELERQSQYGSMVGSSEFMQSLREQIARHAHHDHAICIVGESGVGKFHIASTIHRESDRRERPILSVEGENFSLADWDLKVRAAKGGTIVLEQAELVQPDTLMQLILSPHQSRIIMTARTMPNIRIQTLEVIPLRERTDDIPELVYEFLDKAGIAFIRDAISEEAMQMLTSYTYGLDNIRELKQVVHDALIRSEGRMIRNNHLRFSRKRKPGSRPMIGLALGSGSVRGAAHVGVLKVLEEANIPVDMVAGTSVGAFIGALYVGGQPISAFERVLPTVRWRQLVRPSMFSGAFVHNHPMARFVEKFIGPVRFEELPKPFAAVASDAITGEAYILNKGRVSNAICASTAIPGFIRPVQYDNRLLVDGAVVQPVPVSLVRNMGADIVIAVDVSAPSTKAPKSFVSSVLNTIEIMSEKILQEELQLADVVLRPQLDINQITFKASASYIAVGEKVTREAMATIKRKFQAIM